MALPVVVGDGGAAPHAHTTISPRWPGVAYQLACPRGTPQTACELLSRRNSSAWLHANCFEPEADTAEVLNSFLLGCHSRACSYVDIGCNLGIFAAQAAALGVSSVACYEPTPLYAQAIERTRKLNGFAEAQLRVHNVAVVPGVASSTPRAFSGAYNPCGVVTPPSTGSGGAWAPWTSHERSMASVLDEAKAAAGGAPLTLLKLDIDANEGALLHKVVNAIAAGRVGVETIVVELGDNKGPSAWERGRPRSHPRLVGRNSSRHPRGGDVADLWRLQHELGYTLYRLNIVVGREIYDWRGHDVTRRKAAIPNGLEVLYGVRAMRRLERVLPSLPLDDYVPLLSWGVSFLATRVQLAEPATHHIFDLQQGLVDGGLAALNHGNPAVRGA